MEVVGVQLVVQYLLEGGFFVDVVLLVEVGQYTLDLAYRLI
jgi:hypothetical protein